MGKRFRDAVRRWWRSMPKWVRRWIAGIAGTTVLLIGIALIVLPGPAILVIPLGLAILASEFVWAERCLEWLQNQIRNSRLRQRLMRWRLAKRSPLPARANG